MNNIESTPEFVANAYAKMERNLEVIRRRLGRPLTLAEKVLLGHLDDPETADLRPGESYILLRPDRVAMQDATAQMALLQFAQAGIPRVAVPTHGPLRPPDPRLPGREPGHGGRRSTRTARSTRSCRAPRRRYGIGFWKPGAGHHPPGRAGELRLPRRDDDRHRLAHAQRRRPGHVRLGRRRRRRGGRDGRLPLGGQVPEADRRPADRQALAAGPRPRT